jgi:starch synthase
MQVYFIDNDDYFHRKHAVMDEAGNPFPDNDERAIFFARGVFETVRKLRWSPDLIYCQGWFTALLPLYLKKEYNDDPIFSKSKIVFSTYNDQFDGSLNLAFAQKALTAGVVAEDLSLVKEPSHVNLNKLAFHYADGIIFHHRDVVDELKLYASSLSKPILENPGEEGYIDAYSEFFDNLMLM